MKEIEMEGKTVTIAVENGLGELGLKRDQVEVEVLDQGSPGILGFGTKPARVRIRAKQWGEGTPAEAQPQTSKAQSSTAGIDPVRPPRAEPRPRQGPPRGERPPRREQRPERPERGRPSSSSREEHSRAPRTEAPRPQRTAPPRARTPEDTAKACQVAEETLKEVLSLALLQDAKVRCSWDAAQDRVKAEVETADAGLLIGKGGRTLESLQFLITVMVGRKTGIPTAIQVECEGYWQKIEAKIIGEAEQAASEVKRTGRPYRFDPMEPALRRLIHRRLVDDPEVETASEGEGPWRKVVVKPKKR
ncbi:MAG: RNA-binding cell elongation regulator Jag/EloR [Elusimicrobiota bacterium]